MALGETLQRILTDFPTAKTHPLKNHPFENFVRGEAETAFWMRFPSLHPAILFKAAPSADQAYEGSI
jgi:hypothetical protein